MKHIKFCILILTIHFLSITSLYGMLNKINPATLKKVSAIKRAGQRRTLYTPERLKGLYTPLTIEAQKASPLHGAVEFETKAIKRRYEMESQAFGPQLVRELFFQQGSQFRPTSSKSKAAYSLSPEIVGLVIGALETGRLQEQKVRNYIIDQWQNEYRKITEDKKPFSRGKIEKLLTLIENEYNNDKESCRKILLGFLYAKALPDDDHDMIHYLAGLNEFINVFTDQSGSAAKSVSTYVAQKKGMVQLKPEPTFFEKLRSGAQTIKSYVLGSSNISDSSGNIYTQKDYDVLKESLQKTDRSKSVKQALKEKFELVVSIMLNEKRDTSLYPPKVVQSSYGYKDKSPAPNCVETAINDLLNIMLYNSQLKTFDLSLLPSSLLPNDKFKQFYTQYGVDKLNARECGQAFMNLVSGIDGVVYKREDYELAANESEKNLLTLMNYFFGINAQNLHELGAKLSDDRRTIIFTGPIPDKESMEIIMTIKDNKTNNSQQAILRFRLGHGEIKVPEREAQEIKKSLLSPLELVQNYRINPEVQPLLRIEPMGIAYLMYAAEEPPKKFYYVLPVETDNEKISVISNIANYASNIDEEAFDYAFHLYQQLSLHNQEDLLPTILRIEKKGGIKWQSHTKFKRIIIDNYREALKTRRFSGSSKEYIDFVKELYKELPDDISKYKLIIDSLDVVINMKILDTDFVKILYEQIAENKYRKKFLADLLLVFAKYPGGDKKIDCVAIAEQCIKDGADLIGGAVNADHRYSTTPFASALRMNNVPLVELLINHGISVNESLEYEDKLGDKYYLQVNKYPVNKYYENITPLGIAVSEENEKMVEFLLKNGANPNIGCNFYLNGWKITYPIFISINVLNENIFNLLLQYGANINIHNSSQETPLDFFNKGSEGWGFTTVEGTWRNILLNAGAKKSEQLLQEQIKGSNAIDNQELLNRE